MIEDKDWRPAIEWLKERGIYDRDERDTPQGKIQWKGTNVCMDVWCACGTHSHIDAYYAHMFRCWRCGKTYFVSPYVNLYEVPFYVSGLTVEDINGEHSLDEEEG